MANHPQDKAPPQKASKNSSFWTELKRRKVMRVAITYVIASIAIIEFASATFGYFDIPKWAFQLMTLCLVCGFPIAVIIAWAFELTPDGIKTTKAADEERGDAPVSEKQQRKRNWFSVIFAAAVPTVIFGTLALIFYIQLGGDSEAEIGEKSIAVLPLENMSPDPDNAFFADGVQEDILTNLASVKDLLVIGRTSTLQYKNTTKTLQKIGSELGARYLVEGSVRRYDNEIRVTAQLIDSQTGGHVWANEYDRQLDDIFSIQSEIALSIAEELESVLSPEEVNRIERIPTTDLLAYEWYLQGLEHQNLGTNKGFIDSIERFNAAIGRDPDFLLAHIAKARSYRQRMTYFEPPIEMLAKVREIYTEVLRLDSESAEVRSVVGTAYLQSWNWDDAWHYLNDARSRDPRISNTHMSLGIYYTGLGEQELAFDAFSAADRLDPFNHEIASWAIFCFTMLGETAKARQWAETKLKAIPDNPMLMLNAGWMYSLQGEHQTAINLAKRAKKLVPDSPFFRIALSHTLAQGGFIKEAREEVMAAEKSDQYVCPYETAISYILLGDHDSAFDLLDKAVNFRSNCLIFTRQDPRLDPLRDDPRFKALLERIGLDDASLKEYPR